MSNLNDGPWSGRLVFIVSLILVLLIGFQLAQLTWTLIAPDAAMVTEQAAARTAPVEVDPARIASRNLFGRADPGQEPAVVDAPDTQLNLTLRGIAAGREESSRALIAGPDGRERVYAVGAAVPGGATVHRVLADRVLLDRRGTLETLRLPRESAQQAGAPLAPPPGGVVDNLQDVNGAEELAEIVRAMPVNTDGQLRGFRVYPGRDRQRFAALGLRAGDLVTAIDGVTLDNEEALRRLMGSEQVTLTIERGGQVESLTVRLDR